MQMDEKLLQLTGMIGPYFYQKNNQAVTMDPEHYCTMLQTFLAMELQRMRQRVRNVWFQQDGAMAHMARQSMTYLRGGKVSGLLNLRFDDIP
jgi:hypothetical protein